MEALSAFCSTEYSRLPTLRDREKILTIEKCPICYENIISVTLKSNRDDVTELTVIVTDMNVFICKFVVLQSFGET